MPQPDVFELPSANHHADLESQIQTETDRCLEAGSVNVFDEVMHRVEATIILTVLRQTNNNLTRAAMRLGISRPTLRTKLRALANQDSGESID